MELKKSIAAKKYALAFFNLYKDAVISTEESLKTAQVKLEDEPFWYVGFHLPNLTREKKINALKNLIMYLNLDTSFEKLVMVLLKHSRITFFPEILRHLLSFCDHLHKRTFCTISSSHALTDTEKERVLSFVSQKINGTLVPTFLVNKKLISGLRIQTNTHVWERSIRKKLRTILTSLT